MDKFDELRINIQKLLNSNKIILLLVRHGETDSNFTKQLSGWHDVPLTQKGEEEAQSLSKVFAPLNNQFQGIYSSDLSRAQKTAEYALKNKDIIIPKQNLRELNFGTHQNEVYSSANQSIYKILFTMQYQAPEGENWFQVKDRIMNYLKSVISEKGVYIVFTHGGAIFSLTHQFGFKNTIKNCSVIALELNEQKDIQDLLFYWEYPII